MNVVVESIPHQEQRYPTVGDWQWGPGKSLTIRVSKLSNWRYGALVAIHELIEAVLCEHAGITTEQVDAFDMKFEAERPEGSIDEPGDHPDCPCRRQHAFSSAIERLLAEELGVDWKAYEDEVNSLGEESEHAEGN